MNKRIFLGITFLAVAVIAGCSIGKKPKEIAIDAIEKSNDLTGKKVTTKIEFKTGKEKSAIEGEKRVTKDKIGIVQKEPNTTFTGYLDRKTNKQYVKIGGKWEETGEDKEQSDAYLLEKKAVDKIKKLPENRFAYDKENKTVFVTFTEDETNEVLFGRDGAKVKGKSKMSFVINDKGEIVKSVLEMNVIQVGPTMKEVNKVEITYTNKIKNP